MTAPGSTVDWKRCQQYVVVAVALYEGGGYDASITSYYGSPRRWRRHRLPGGWTQGEVAPPALSALQEAVEQALDRYWRGELG